MTVYIALPLPPSASPGAGPSRMTSPMSIAPAQDDQLREVVSAIRSSRRVVVVCGAGVSTAADIPDFRSASGLFGGGNGKGKGKEPVKDLFHVKALSSPNLLAAHHALITELASLALTAQPTSLHRYLAQLDNQGRLLRVYTQNIDGLEEKAGLTIGIPKAPPPSPRRKKASHPPYSVLDPPSVSQIKAFSTPRVIPLHGTLSTLQCTLCHSSFPLLPHLPLPPTALPCPTCDLADTIRCALSERRRNSGRLRPSIVLYGEEHPQGDLIGRVVERDLKGTGGMYKEGKVDFLLVAGTSLSIPGVKRIVKEMARVVHGPAVTATATKGGKARKKVRTVLVNDELPKGDWEEVFDIWIKGDIQRFVTDYLDNPGYEDQKHSVPTTPKKKRVAVAPPTPVSLESKPKPNVMSLDKASSSSSDFVTPIKSKNKRPVSYYLPTPRETPPSPADRTKRPRMEGSPSPSPTPPPVPLSWSATGGTDSSNWPGRKAFEGSLTPLSEVDAGAVSQEGKEGEVENPFLNLASVLQRA